MSERQTKVTEFLSINDVTFIICTHPLRYAATLIFATNFTINASRDDNSSGQRGAADMQQITKKKKEKENKSKEEK